MKKLFVLCFLFLSVVLIACDVKTTTNQTTTNNTTTTTTTMTTTSTTTSVTTTATTTGELNTIEAKVAKLISEMTLEEKAGQMLQAERGSATPLDVKTYNLGSILSGGGSVPGNNTVYSWNMMYNGYRTASLESSSGIPIIYGVDAVHGHNNVYGSTIFPHNIGLGAANDPELMTRIGDVVAKEVALTGLDWNFAPAVSTVQDLRWGRTYEGFSENPVIVENLVEAYIGGLQNYNIAATAKHFIGDGATYNGIDRGNAIMTEEELREIYLPAYKQAIDSGVKTVMISYSSFNGVKMHQNKYLITNVLKNELGFKGIVVSDWEAINEVSGNTKKDKVIKSINAGIDVLMEPNDWKNVYNFIIEGVNEDKISMDRINDAVTRILTVKYELGLFEDKVKVQGNLREASSLEVAREAVRKSLVLLENNNSTLPLQKDQKVLLLGPGRDSVGIQSGGWTIWWQGGENQKLTVGTTIKEAFSSVLSANGGTLYTNITDLDQADVVVLVLAEKPYAEGAGDNSTLTLDGKTGYAENIQLINQLKDANIPVVTILVSGRPLLVNDYVGNWDAFVMAWLPGTEGAGVTDVLFGDYDFTGKLPYTWPKDISQANHSSIRDNYDPTIYQYPYGYGLNYNLIN